MGRHLPVVPVPKVYSHSLLENSGLTTHYIAEEFIDGECLSTLWKSYDESTKSAIASQIAEIIVTLGETTFDSIGSLMLDHTLGPTVEGIKLFKGRVSSTASFSQI